MDSQKSFIKSCGKRSLPIVLSSILFLIIFLSAMAPSQAEEANSDQAMHHLAQYIIQVGTTQYEGGHYSQAEKTLLMAQSYVEYLTAAERDKLNELLKKTQLAARESNRALEQKQLPPGSGLEQPSKQGQIQGKPSLLSATSADTSQSSGQATGGGPDKNHLANAEQKPQISESQTNDRNRQVAEIYYRSMRLYNTGQLEKAREGFIEVINSGSIPPAMVKTLQGYLTETGYKS